MSFSVRAGSTTASSQWMKSTGEAQWWRYAELLASPVRRDGKGLIFDPRPGCKLGLAFGPGPPPAGRQGPHAAQLVVF